MPLLERISTRKGQCDIPIKLRSSGVCGLVKHLFRRAHFVDAALVHEHQTRTDIAGKGHFVRDP